MVFKKDTIKELVAEELDLVVVGGGITNVDYPVVATKKTKHF